MAETLYSREILKLAMALGDGDMPGKADGHAELRSPVCGSKIEASVMLDDNGHIAQLGLQVNACAMGQASAAIVKRHGAGQSYDQIAALRGDLHAFLSGDGDMPALWPELSQLAPARVYPARHGAIMLPYDAILAAMKAALD